MLPIHLALHLCSGSACLGTSPGGLGTRGIVEEPRTPAAAPATQGPPKLARGAFHAYRRLWALERMHLPDVDVAAAGGWQVPGTMKQSYQHADAATMLQVIERGA